MFEFLLTSVAVVMAVAAVWLAMRTLVRHVTGLRGRLEVDSGPVVRWSRWGDANINGMGFQDCVRVAECGNGWVVQVRLIGGRLWLPRAQTRVGKLEGVGQLTGPHRTLETGAHRIKLEGDLAEFIADSAVAADGPELARPDRIVLVG
jgi:hypothetical protein